LNIGTVMRPVWASKSVIAATIETSWIASRTTLDMCARPPLRSSGAKFTLYGPAVPPAS
jgi:hypothetical protein